MALFADYKVTQAMMRYFINKTTSGFKIFKPELVISVPAGITSTERRAVIEAALSLEQSRLMLLKNPFWPLLELVFPSIRARGT